MSRHMLKQATELSMTHLRLAHRARIVKAKAFANLPDPTSAHAEATFSRALREKGSRGLID